MPRAGHINAAAPAAESPSDGSNDLGIIPENFARATKIFANLTRPDMTKFKDGKKRSSGCGNVECFIKAVKKGDVLDAWQALVVIIQAQSLKGPDDECVVADGNNPQRMLLLHIPCGDHKEHYYRFDLTTALIIGAGLVVKKKHMKILLGGIGKVVNTSGRGH
jgi:hypothetical protein